MSTALLTACQQALPGLEWELFNPFNAHGTHKGFSLSVIMGQDPNFTVWLHLTLTGHGTVSRRFVADTLDDFAAEVRECLTDLSAAALQASSHYPRPKRAGGAQ